MSKLKINTEKTEQKPRKNAKPRALWQKIVLAAALTLAGLILLDLILAVVQICVWIRPEKQGFTDTPAAYGLSYHTFELKTAHGTVTGWQIPAQTSSDEEAEEWVPVEDFSDRTVVCAINYDSNRQMNDVGGIDYFVSLCSAGYNVFVFDWTGSGYSDGHKNVFCLDKTEELDAVVGYAKQTSGCSFLAVQGVGFGCYPAVQVTAARDDVNALILDSCYAEFGDWIDAHYSAWATLPFQPVSGTVKVLFPLLSGVDPDGVGLTEAVSQMSGKKILFIQSEHDEQFGTGDAQALAELAKGKNSADLWVVSEANHLRAYSADPDAYVGRVTAFLDGETEA